LLVGVAERLFDEAQREFDDFAGLPDWSLASVEDWLRRTATERILSAPRYRMVMTAARSFLASPAALFRVQGLIDAVLSRAGRWGHLERAEAAARARMLVILLEQQFYDLLAADEESCDVERFVRYTANATVLLLS
jgi:hypothetical protein